VASAKGFLTDPENGSLVMRGANVSRYQLREASQGQAIYLNVDAFLDRRGEETKAFHHRLERVGLQESSAQNNFRRLIACRIPRGYFCNHKINYTTEKHSRIPLELVLFILNSTFADWYFRLGSTNAAVSHYQLLNIPCPRLSSNSAPVNQGTLNRLKAQLEELDFAAIEKVSLALASRDGCSPTLTSIIVRLVHYIEREEEQRGHIARTARSRLSDHAEACQAILNKTILALLGLGAEKHEYIEARLKRML
ncbi:MAG: hypothetical protein OXI24_07585, partial [Candidatus Poribacteria bacterium]|nr:hypothetical protein [Candidatus Poribacteria bacterium]